VEHLLKLYTYILPSLALESRSHPINIFSKSTPKEQIYIRIDDKLNRIHKGKEYASEDTILDLIGYLVLLRTLDNER